MEKKITKRMVVERMLATEEIVANADFKAYLENELALLNKKAENRKPTKAQELAVDIKADIMSVMGGMEPSSATDIMNKVKGLDMDKYAGLSNQKVSALLNQLVADNKVIKTNENRKSLFSIAK